MDEDWQYQQDMDELEYRSEVLDVSSYLDSLLVLVGIVVLGVVIWAVLSHAIYKIRGEGTMNSLSCITGPIAAVLAILIGNWFLSR